MNQNPVRSLRYAAPTAQQLADAEAWVSRFAELWARPNPGALHELMHPDTRNLIPPMTEPGNAAQVVAHFEAALQRLPDFRLEVVRWAVTADVVMIEWQANATVAGKPLEWRGVDRISLRDGKTYEGQVYWDTRQVAERVAQAIAEATQATGN